MGTTGTIMGTGRFLKEKNPAIRIVGVHPEPGSQIAGIRKWEDPYVPKICDFSRIDEILHVGQKEAEDTARLLARREGILAGPSSGGALAVALRLDAQLRDAVIVSVVCDRGDRYLSTGLFDPA
ncbi:Cysteine synthase B [Chromobacterium violaceum]|nr:Cysteine synthase B [Chromobacterium violaceum]